MVFGLTSARIPAILSPLYKDEHVTLVDARKNIQHLQPLFYPRCAWCYKPQEEAALFASQLIEPLNTICLHSVIFSTIEMSKVLFSLDYPRSRLSC